MDDDEDESVFMGTSDPSLFNISFSVNEFAPTVQSQVCAALQSVITKLNAIALRLVSPQAKRKLSKEDKEELSTKISNEAHSISDVLSQLKSNPNLAVEPASARTALAAYQSLVRGGEPASAGTSRTGTPSLVRSEKLVSAGTSQTDAPNPNNFTLSSLFPPECSYHSMQMETNEPYGLNDPNNFPLSVDPFQTLTPNHSTTLYLSPPPNPVSPDLLTPCEMQLADPTYHPYLPFDLPSVDYSSNHPNNCENSPASVASLFTNTDVHRSNATVEEPMDLDQNSHLNLTKKNKHKKKKSFDHNIQLQELKNALHKIGRLKKSVLVNVDKQSDYTKIKNHLITCDHYKNGSINPDDIKVNHKGKITILCNTIEMINPVKEEISKLGFTAYLPVIKNVLVCAHGISSVATNEAIINEICRDRKFNKDNLKIETRFKFTRATHTVVFSISPEILRRMLFSNAPYIHVFGRKFNLFYFVKLIQCFKCGDFGHLETNCSADTPSCVNCAEPHHKSKCSNNNFRPCCINCTRKNMPNANHSSWEVGCPYRKRFIKWNRTRFNYG